MLAVIFGLSACTFDEAGSLKNCWISLATIQSTQSQGVMTVQLDNGTSAVVTDITTSGFNATVGERVLINYTLESDSLNAHSPRKIKINAISDVAIKEIGALTTANADSLGNDPVTIEKIWLGGTYLNVSFQYYGSKGTHLFSMAQNDTTKTTNDGKLHLVFTHNANGDNDDTQEEGVISFNIKQLITKLQASPTQIIIEAKNYAGNVIQYELAYTAQ